MAIRFDAATDRVSYSGAVPDPSTGITITAWAYLSVDRDTYSTVARLWAAGDSTTGILGTGSDGEIVVYITGGGTVVGAHSLVVPQWFRLGVTCLGVSALLYSATESGPTGTGSGTVGGAASPIGLTLGGRSPGDGAEWFNGRLAYVRLWSSVFSQPQIEAEWASTTPVVTAGLWADWPLAVAADLTDHSGNGRHLVAGATPVTTEDGPSIGVTGLPVRHYDGASWVPAVAVRHRTAGGVWADAVAVRTYNGSVWV